LGHADLKIVPLVEEDDTVLAAPDRGSNTLKPTTLWHRVEALIAAWRPALTVFDPLADLFGGDENSRPQARQFIGMLRGLARRQNTTVVLLAHPSLAGMASRSGSSGSTAWNNSVRSRLYLTRITREDGPKSNIEPDADRRLLTAVKSNYARRGTEIALRWRAGVFVPEDTASAELAAGPQQALHDEVFLDLLERYRRQGREVSATPSANFAPATFTKEPGASGISRLALTGAMNRLLGDGRIAIEEFGPPSKRRKRLIVVAT